MSALQGGVYLRPRALWCWDEYRALSPAQKRLARQVEREEYDRATLREHPDAVTDKSGRLQ